MPTPRTFNGKKYYGTDDVAKIIGVGRSTVSWWHNKGLFTADERAHDGRYLYEVERVMQLKAVYHPNWTRGGYESINTQERRPTLHKFDDPELNRIYDIVHNLPADYVIDKLNLTKTPDGRFLCPACGQPVIFGTCGNNSPLFKCEECHTNWTVEDLFGFFNDIDTSLLAGLKDALLKAKVFFADKFPPGQSEQSENVIVREPKNLMENLPSEMSRQKRFFPVGADKHPFTKAWSNPDNQMILPVALKQSKYVGFDCSGHDEADDYVLFDFDHVLDDNGEFVSKKAEDYVDSIQSRLGTYIERSISGHGLHIFAKPTHGKFYLISAGTKGTLHFKDAPDAKLEIFYKTGGRYCLVTGDLYDCDPRTTIASGERVDEVFQEILDDIQKSLPPAQVKSEKNHNSGNSQVGNRDDSYQWLGRDYDLFRINIMLEKIPPADLSDSDWLAVQTACKNEGVAYDDDDAWNRRDPDRYDEKENRKRWDSLKDPNFNIETIHGIAKRYGYEEREARQLWFELHPELKEFSAKTKRNVSEEIQRQINEAVIRLEKFTKEEFSEETAYTYVRALALAQCFGFAAECAKFFSLINAAKADAKKRLAESDNELVAPMEPDEINRLEAIKHFRIGEFRKAIDNEVKQVKLDAHNATVRDLQRKNAEIQKQQAAEREQTKSDFEKLLAEAPSPERDDKLIETIRELCDWQKDIRGNRVAVKATQANLDLIFQNDPNLNGLFGFDEFRQADVYLKTPPWNKKIKRGDELTDNDDSQVQVYVRRNYGELTSKDKINQTVDVFTRENSFNEVKQYLESLPKWDGKKRAETFFIDWLKVADNKFVREATLKWLLAAVARIYHSGCEFQWALVLHGNQKIGKGFLLKRLGGKWYKSITDRVDDPHAADTVRLVWLGEFKEFAGMRKADVNAIKSFIELPADTRRFAFERRAKTIQRHCVFAITVNDDNFLSDLTGNRRFIVFHSNLPKFGYVHEVRGERLTDEVVAQIWAEVLEHYNRLFTGGFDESKLNLSADTEQYGEEIANAYVNDNGLIGEIGAFLDRKILPPIIWDLLTREDRRKFVAESKFVVEKRDLVARFKNSAKKISAKRQAEFDAAIKESDSVLHITIHSKFGEEITGLEFHGTEYRQHISPLEIFTECFTQNDKRKNLPRIHEILAQMEGWHLGKRLQKEPAYGDQKNVYYRDDDNQPADEDDINGESDDATRNTSINTESSAETFSPTNDELSGKPLTDSDTPPPDDDIDVAQFD